MPNKAKEFFIGGRSCCCCVPVRYGIIAMAFLTMLVSGILSILSWFEVSTLHDMSKNERTGFILLGLVETLLCATSILGFAGTLAQKLVFVRAYAYFLWAHLLVNLVAAIYVLSMIVRATNTDVVKGCQRLVSAGSQSQCTGLLNIATGVFIGVAAVLLVIELYMALIATRYMRYLRNKKRGLRSANASSASYAPLRPGHARTGTEDIALWARGKPGPPGGADGAYDDDAFAPPPADDARAFDPYAAYHDHDAPDADAGAPPLAHARVEDGYGGGRWTYADVEREEKERVGGVQLTDPPVRRMPSAGSGPPQYEGDTH